MGDARADKPSRGGSLAASDRLRAIALSKTQLEVGTATDVEQASNLVLQIASFNRSAFCMCKSL
ncbi:hypothetical protein [Stenomitos frigidus]|uniref:Uncharacterized protein n=1 Tax=Stenomitos frigidus ULC18 TaxID=2107698 RepID=A0A2T1DV02_9CYAN|nr:hypothetical protein [Stenomitos frigidus]PSB24261.1 hypothetical protein C7B82_27655 [Stenomitos frigidus ULC18]